MEISYCFKLRSLYAIFVLISSALIINVHKRLLLSAHNVVVLWRIRIEPA